MIRCIINIIKTLNRFGLAPDCSTLSLNPTKIEFRLKKHNSNSIQVLKMIVQTRPNVGLDRVSSPKLHP